VSAATEVTSILCRDVFLYLETRMMLGSERILNRSDTGYWFTEFPYMTASARSCFSVVFLELVLTNLCFCRWMWLRVVIIIVTNTGFTYMLNSNILNVNKNPTRCNSMQIFIYCKVTLHVSGVTAPIIRSTKNCNRSLRYRYWSRSGHVGGK